MVPAVARVSAPKMTPFLNLTPTMVVPVEVCFGSLNPLLVNARFLFDQKGFKCSCDVPLVVVKLEPRVGIADCCHRGQPSKEGQLWCARASWTDCVDSLISFSAVSRQLGLRSYVTHFPDEGKINHEAKGSLGPGAIRADQDLYGQKSSFVILNRSP